MDLSNLTFDELLDAIRSDSGYQSAQARKSAVPCEETAASDTKENSDVSYSVAQAEASPAEEVTVDEPVSEPEEVDPIPEPEVIKPQQEEPMAVFPPVQDLFEIIEPTEEEEPPAFEPSAAVDSFYVPEPTVQTSVDEAAEEEQITVFDPTVFSQPLALADEETDDEGSETGEEQETTVYTPPSPPEPIEIVSPEEAEDEEPIKIYTPPKPEPIDIGGFNIDTDVASLFPELPSDADFEEEPAVNSNTRVIEPILSTAQEPSLDKTRVVEPVADDKTRAVEFEGIFERPGIVTTRSAYDKTSDLSALPHILPADEFIGEEPKTFVRTGEIPKVDSQPRTPVVRHEEEEQMMLPGFFEKEEIVRVSENEVEEELKRTRSRKVDSFKLEGAEIEETGIDEEVSKELTQGISEGKKRRFSLTKTRHRLTKQRVEFTRPSDGRKVRDFIARKKLISIISTIITGVCSLVLLITTAIPAVADAINSGTGVNGAPVTYLISLIFLCISVAAALPSCFTGVTCFFTGTGRPNSQTPVIIAAAAALIQNIIALSAYSGEEYPLFSLAAAFLLCCCSAGNILVHSRVMSNFAFLFKQGRDGLYNVRAIDNAIDANRVSQNVVPGNADIRYSGKLKFATRFMSYSLSSDSTDDLCAKLVPIVTAVSAVIGIIAGIVTKSFVGGFTLFSGALCMGAPACALIASNLPLLLENKSLHEDGAMISSYAAAFEYESTNAVAIDASELFPGENCNIHGMKTFNGVRVDDAVLTAASMLIAAGGPISSLFENVIMEHNELLLKVEELKYEERLGLSGWIRGRRIFVGNRKLLENHNIEIPMSVDEAKYIRGDRQIIYLADAGKIAAFFVVSYGRNKKIAEYLRKIENNGINILVRTTDSNINEKFIARCFDLPLNSVKVVSNTAGEVLRNYSEHTVTREDAKLIHNGTAAAFLHAVSAAGKLCSTAGKISTLQTFCTAAGLLLTVLIMIFSGPLTLTALPVCICQILWLAISAISPLFGKE